MSIGLSRRLPPDLPGFQDRGADEDEAFAVRAGSSPMSLGPCYYEFRAGEANMLQPIDTTKLKVGKDRRRCAICRGFPPAAKVMVRAALLEQHLHHLSHGSGAGICRT
jgi:hypothetical protein